ncbi:hypothetical protein [Kribbella sp. NPDC000426]|uniref:hypothetical protein n=1 Tax=Kribbella sp. NPDC000426 TaxID=3154255 RepID=UPI00332FD0AD
MSNIRRYLRRQSLVAAVAIAGAGIVAGTAVATPARSLTAGLDGYSQVEITGGRIQIGTGDSSAFLETIGARRGSSVLDVTAGSSAVAGPVVTTSRGQFSETVQKGAAGAEQSWTLDHAPGTSGDLTIAVVTSGLDLTQVTDSGLVLRGAGVNAVNVSYSNGTWIDANGHASPVPARYANGQILLTVPAKLIAETAFPAVLDPQIIVTPIT